MGAVGLMKTMPLSTFLDLTNRNCSWIGISLASLWLIGSTFQLTAAERKGVNSRPFSTSFVKNRSGFARLSNSETGIEFTNFLKEENIRKYVYNGAGGCAGDFDGDGRPDLYLVSQDGKNKLWRQTRAWSFEDATQSAGVDGGDHWGTGACFVDIDNDGDLDLHVANLDGGDFLYLNLGDGTFREEAEKRALDHPGPTIMSCFCDYDRDGDLDCYLVNYRLFEVAEDAPEVTIRLVNGKPAVHPEFVDQYTVLEGRIVEVGRPDRLLRNDGGGFFTDVSGAAGLGRDRNHGLSATWFDYNNDRWPDLYVASDFYSPDRLWRNNGDGTFTDALPEMAAYTPWFAMGSDFGDLNRDGWFDLLVADMSAMTHYRQKMEMGEMGRSAWFLEYGEPRQVMRNVVYLNAGGRRFLEAGFQTGLESTGWTWAARFADLDCDGWEDAAFCNGMARDVNNSDFLTELRLLAEAGKIEERRKMLENFQKPGSDRNKVFRNRDGYHFEDVSEAWGFHQLSASYGLILADLDRDGDLDAVTTDMNQPVGIYRNDAGSGNRVLVELRGKTSNSYGVGAQVRIKSSSGRQSRMLTIARGYQSGDEPVIHFGLGTDPTVDEMVIDWPGGARQVLRDLEVNRIHRIVEPEGDFSPQPAREAPPPQSTLFARDAVPGFSWRHEENDWNDFEKQPLLPWKVSRFGPGLAFGDVDGDGDEDLWVGGAAGQKGALLLRSQDSRWVATPFHAAGFDQACEDMAAVFFDPDKDGDLDLYVASGGNHDNKAARENRLYLNMKTGSGDSGRGFAKADPDPDVSNRRFLSSGPLAAADFDRDGDVDLFVGARLTPGALQQPPPQLLLRNEGSRLVDVSAEIAPGLRGAGLVTGALWTDANNDSLPDLIVTTAWGPIRLYVQSANGKLRETTEAAGLGEAHGWWQGIAGGDFDGDGDIDYAATNLGHNTKYHASPKKPFLLFAADFDGNGSCDLVEAEYEGDTLYPVRGRSCSSLAMPFIKEKFATFHDFASADLNQIYSAEKLNEASAFTLTHLDSSLLVNDGQGRFSIEPLPELTQVAPGFGIVAEDFDGDGNLDIVMVQNFYSPQPETGRMSGGLGAFLKGRGDGRFDPVAPQDSGVLIHEDARSLAVGDFDGDGAPDLVCGVCNGPLVTLRNQTRGPAKRWTTIILEGKPGNPLAAGARLWIGTSKGRELLREVTSGGGYLSQSTARQFVALDREEIVSTVRIRWPGAAGESKTEFADYKSRLVISQD